MFSTRFAALPFLLLPLAISSCALVEPHAERPAPSDLSDSQPAKDTREYIGRLLAGSFSSAAQAERDDDFFDIRLEVVPIWLDRTDGPWLYVEQAAASALDRPYRQRVYELEGDPNQGFRSIVYELPGDSAEFAGAYDEVERFDELNPEDLLVLEGCTVFLTLQQDMTVLGGTRAAECGTDWGDAKYATSEVTLTPDWMESWDRGYDAEGNQVWGATKGPYRFDRLPR